MSDLYKRRGRKPLAAARIVEVMRRLANQNAPIPTAVLRKHLPDLPASSLLRAVQWLRDEAGLLVRNINGTNVREYLLGTQHRTWAISLSPEQVRKSARAETSLLIVLQNVERGKP